MLDQRSLQEFVDSASVEEAVFALRPDYRAVLLVVDGLEAGPDYLNDSRTDDWSADVQWPQCFPSHPAPR